MVMQTKKVLVQGLATIGFALLSLNICVSAEEGPVGEWNLTAEFGGRTNESTLNVSKDGDNLKAIMVSQRGERELDDVERRSWLASTNPDPWT